MTSQTPLVDRYPAISSSKKYPASLYISFVVISCIALVAVGFLLFRPVSQMLIPTGYLCTNEHNYLNVSERLFPEHPTNLTRAIAVAKEPVTIWMQEFLNEDRTRFVLKTEVEGIMYAVQMGPPGAGAEWGIAFVGPLGAYPNVTFDKNMMASKPAWPDEGTRLTERNDKVFWTNTVSRSVIRMVQT